MAWTNQPSGLSPSGASSRALSKASPLTSERTWKSRSGVISKNGHAGGVQTGTGYAIQASIDSHPEGVGGNIRAPPSHPSRGPFQGGACRYSLLRGCRLKSGSTPGSFPAGLRRAVLHRIAIAGRADIKLSARSCMSPNACKGRSEVIRRFPICRAGSPGK
jgi:hypothetical protein